MRRAPRLLLAVSWLAIAAGTLAAAPHGHDVLEGVWLGEAGPADDRAHVGLEVRRDGGDALTALLTIDLVHFFVAPAGGVEVRGDGHYAIPDAELALTLGGDGRLTVTGLLDEKDAPVTLTRGTRPPARPASPVAPSGPGPRWKTRLGGPIFATAAVRDGVAYVGNSDGVMFAVALADGGPRWKFPAGRPIFGEALATDDALYFVCDSGFLFRLDRSTGKEVWRYDLGDAQVSRILPNPLIFDYDHAAPRPLLADGVLYVGSGDGSLHAVRGADGTRLWRAGASAKVRASAALAGDRVIVADLHGRVAALERATGAEVWRLEAGDPIPGAPLIAGDRVIVGTRGSKLLGLDLASGAPAWSQSWWGSWVESPAVVEGGHAYLGSGDLFRVSSLDPSTGRTEWRTDVGGWILKSVAVTPTRVYAGVSGARRRASFWVPQKAALAALDRATGKLLWSWPMPAWDGAFLQGFVAGPAIADSTLVVGGIDGTLYGFPAE